MKTLLLKIFFSSLIIVNNCFAQDVIFLEQNSPAPFKGYLFPEDKALDLKKQLIELDKLKLLEKSYESSIDLYKKNEELYNKKIDILLDQNDRLANALKTSRDWSETEKTIWFLAGIFVTGAGAYTLSKIK